MSRAINESHKLYKRYQPADYSEDIIYQGDTLAILIEEENKSYNIAYERPVFNAPLINSASGNIFSVINYFEACMKQNGYADEFIEFSRDGLKNLQYKDVVNRMALFVDMENVVKTVNVEGEIFQKIIKTPEHVKNLPEFKITTIAEFDALIKNGFDITSTNTYGRNILHYIKQPELLQYIVDYNEKLKEDKKPHIRFTDLDNFNSTLLSNRENLKCFNIIFEAMYKEIKEKYNGDKSMMDMLVFGRDVFNNNSISAISERFQEVFSSMQSMKTNLKSMIDTLSMISTVDPSYSQSVINQTRSSDFIKALEKQYNVNASEIKTVIETNIIEYNYNILEEKISKKTNDGAKKMKI